MFGEINILLANHIVESSLNQPPSSIAPPSGSILNRDLRSVRNDPPPPYEAPPSYDEAVGNTPVNSTWLRETLVEASRLVQLCCPGRKPPER